MAYNETTLIVLPLLLLLLALVAHELRSDLIPDKATFPAAAYFLAARALLGPEIWWHYPASLLAVLCIFLVFGCYIPMYCFRYQPLGGGALKLLALMGAALGFNATFQFGALFAFLVLLALVLGYLVRLDRIPSSLYVLLAYGLTLRYPDMVADLLMLSG